MSATIPAAVNALGYIGIGARDLDAWERFATELLGLELAGRDADGTLHLRMDDQLSRINVHPGDDDLLYAGWEVAGEAELAALAERLRADRVVVRAGTPDECRARQVCGMLVCADPGKLPLEIIWGPFLNRSVAFRSPRPIAGFVTGDRGLGHIVITVSDAEQTMHFYRDVLGMRVTDYLDYNRRGTMVTMAFMHCNPRHHSLAFVAVPGAPKRLTHVMLEMRELDDVGRTHTLCEQRGAPLAMTLGRHTNDEMFSFYAVSPSGFNVEVGFGGRIIDEATWQIGRHQVASVWGHRRVATPVS